MPSAAVADPVLSSTLLLPLAMLRRQQKSRKEIQRPGTQPREHSRGHQSPAQPPAAAAGESKEHAQRAAEQQHAAYRGEPAAHRAQTFFLVMAKFHLETVHLRCAPTGTGAPRIAQLS